MSLLYHVSSVELPWLFLPLLQVLLQQVWPPVQVIIFPGYIGGDRHFTMNQLPAGVGGAGNMTQSRNGRIVELFCWRNHIYKDCIKKFEIYFQAYKLLLLRYLEYLNWKLESILTVCR